MHVHVPRSESRPSARPAPLLLSTLICWDGQAALILACDAELWRAHTGLATPMERALRLCENGRDALIAVGARSVDAAHHEIPWGVDPAPYNCPQLARFSPAPGFGIFEGIATANRAAALLAESLPGFAKAGAFEISESLSIYSMASLADPIARTSWSARALAEKNMIARALGEALYGESRTTRL